MSETPCSSCSENKIACGLKLTEIDHMALSSPSWNGLNISWEVIESRYGMGKELGAGSYARVIQVYMSSLDSILTISGTSKRNN